MESFVVTLIVAGAGVLAWLVGVSLALQRIRMVRRGLRGTGTIVDMREGSMDTYDGYKSGGPKRVSFPVIEVKDVTTGKRIRFQTTISTSRTVVTLGSQVPVRYLPGLPDQAEIDTPFAMWGFPILACIIGTVFLALWWYLTEAIGGDT